MIKMDWRGRALIAARSVVRDSCKKVFVTLFQGEQGLSAPLLLLVVLLSQ